MKIPANIIVTSKYTSGGEFIIKSNYNNYQGYYYELNNKFYIGKEFKPDATELIQKTSSNTNLLLTSAASAFIYGNLSKQNITNNQEPTSYFYNSTPTDFRYFISKLNVKPTTIKEIDKNTFEQYQNNPIYVSVALSYPNKFIESEIDKAESTIPGIKSYLDTTYTPGVTD
jgi:hypothetical protein